MSRQIRISIDDDEVFERLKRRKDALDLSWEDALRRGLRDSPEPPRGTRAPRRRDERAEPRQEGTRRSRQHRHRGRDRAAPSPFDDDFGERIANQVIASVHDAVPTFDETRLNDEIGRLEDAEDAALVLGDGDGERVPLRVALHTGPDGLDVEVIAVRSGKGTEAMNRFADGARSRVAERFARGETATLELDAGGERYDVRPELTWARGPDGSPTVTDVAIRTVVLAEN